MVWSRVSRESNPHSKVHGDHLGPTGPRWAPCWPHEPLYRGCYVLAIRVQICKYLEALCCWSIGVVWRHWRMIVRLISHSHSRSLIVLLQEKMSYFSKFFFRDLLFGFLVGATYCIGRMIAFTVGTFDFIFTSMVFLAQPVHIWKICTEYCTVPIYLTIQTALRMGVYTFV